MKRYRRQGGTFAAVLLLLVTVACARAGSETAATAAATPTTVTAAEGPCGDGVCDEVEQANPSLCPQDCGAAELAPTETPLAPTLTSTPAPGSKCGDGVCDEAEQADPSLCPADCVSSGEVGDDTEPQPPEEPEPPGETEPEPEEDAEPPCETQEWTIAIEARSTLIRTEPSADLFAALVGGFVVDESCRIRGTSSGLYKNCAYTSTTGLCSYDLHCPEFQAAISGEVVPGDEAADTFKIKVDGSGALEYGTAHCGEVSVPIDKGGVLQDAFGSATRNGGGYLIEIIVPKAGDPVTVRVKGTKQGLDAVAPVNFSYTFYVTLYRGTVLVGFDELWNDWETEHAEWDPMG